MSLARMSTSRWRARLVPPTVAYAALVAHVALIYGAVLRHTRGAVAYPVDDAFIHLALAKQLARSWMYGVTPHEFTAASSSIAWPWLLAFAMKLTGPTPWLPLVLNAAVAGALVVAIDSAVRRLAPDASPAARTVIALVAMALTPLGTLVVLGMEHTAHAAATIAFVSASVSWLADDTRPERASWRRALPVAALAAGTTMWRYEGLFAVALVLALGVVRGRVRASLLVALAGAAPIVAFGIYSTSHGAHFLPTPVLLKGRHFDLKDATAYFDLLGGDLLDRLATEGYALAIAAACASLAFYHLRRSGFWNVNVLALLLTLGIVLMHLEFASVGWFYRYESYFIALGITVVGGTLARVVSRDAWRTCRAQPLMAGTALAAIAIVAAPLCRRAILATAKTPLACRNIYEQQMQSARFLATHFAHDRVAVNDIGAVAWQGSERIVDLMGLATLAVAEAKDLKLDKPLRTADVVRLTEGVQVAVVYDEWFKGNLPPTWLRVGRWTIDENKSCAFPTVAFYATDVENYAKVIDALRVFAPSLPPGVSTDGRYTEHPTATERLRAGDRIAVESSSAAMSGVYVVDPDGTITLRGFGVVLVRDLTPGEVSAHILKRLEDGRRADGRVTTARVARVVARGPSISVGGHVIRSGEVLGLPASLDAAVDAAGPSPSGDRMATWVLRERESGFVKLTRSDLAGSALVDGDIVVVPPAGARVGPSD